LRRTYFPVGAREVRKADAIVLALFAKILGLECEGRRVTNFYGEDCEQQIQDHFPFAFSPPAT
jgi:hypothetical protein